MNKYYKGEPKLLVSVDCIVLGFENKKLQLLVGKRKVEPYSGKLSLYGGFVREDESLKEAAQTEFLFPNAQVSMTSICDR